MQVIPRRPALHLSTLWFLFSAVDQAFLGGALTGQTRCSHFNDLVASLCAIIHWSEGRSGSAERPACFITTGGQSFPPQPCTSVRGDQTLSHMEMCCKHKLSVYSHTHTQTKRPVWRTWRPKSCLDWRFMTMPHSWCLVLLPLSTRNNSICCAYTACRGDMRVFYNAPCWKLCLKRKIRWLVGIPAWLGWSVLLVLRLASWNNLGDFYDRGY